MISEDEAFEKALDLHPELKGWKSKDYDRAEKEQGINWHAHLAIDALVLRRATDPSLPDLGVLNQLQSQGRSKKSAVHMVGEVISTHIWQGLRVVAMEEGKLRPEDIPAEARGGRKPSADELNRKISSLVTANLKT